MTLPTLVPWRRSPAGRPAVGKTLREQRGLRHPDRGGVCRRGRHGSKDGSLDMVLCMVVPTHIDHARVEVAPPMVTIPSSPGRP